MHRVLVAVLLLLTACPAENNKSKESEPVETCTAAGQSCVFAPGKLGVCVESVNGTPPFICQSQH